MDRRSNDQVASWSGNIVSEDRSLRSVLHTLVYRGARAPQGRASRGNLARQAAKVLSKKERKQGKGTPPYLTECTLTKASAGMDAKPRFDLKAPTSKKCT